jgi:hypothetical protein
MSYIVRHVLKEAMLQFAFSFRGVSLRNSSKTPGASLE